MTRNSVDINGMDVFVDMIQTVISHKQAVMIEHHEYYLELADNPKCSLIKYGIFVTITDKQRMSDIEFKFIRMLKNKKDPEDRVADFEWHDENNIPDFDALEKLIKRRKTRDERQKEIQDELEWKELVEKHGLEYIGPLMEMLK